MRMLLDVGYHGVMRSTLLLSALMLLASGCASRGGAGGPSSGVEGPSPADADAPSVLDAGMHDAAVEAGPVAAPDPSVLALALGDSHSCAILEDRTVRCWGSNFAGELGDGLVYGGSGGRPRPAPIPGIKGAASLALGTMQTCVVGQGGEVQCCGERLHFRTDAGGIARGSRSTPRVFPGLVAIAGLSLRREQGCANTRGGDIFCWGREGPAKLRTSFRATQVSLGSKHGCALADNETVHCWGKNFAGQLGRGGRRDGDSPVLVRGLAGVGSIAATRDVTCALLTDGSVRCWGGFVCNPGPIPRADCMFPDHVARRPVAVAGLSRIVSLQITGMTGLALDDNGAVWTFGLLAALGGRASGPVGAAPAAMQGLDPVSQIALGASHSCILLEEGGIRCWGRNHYGQLGDGTFESRETPVALHW